MFPKTYAVTFKESSRWEKMEQRLLALNLPYEKIEGASRISTPALAVLNAIKPLLKPEVNTGVTACIISHLKAIRRGYESGKEVFCVMEDDVIFIENFEKMFEERFANLPDNWKLFMLSSYQISWEDCYWTGKKDLRNLIQANTESWGGYGYLLKREAAEAIVKKTQHLFKNIEKPSLEEIAAIPLEFRPESLLFMIPRQVTYISRPFLVIEKSEDTYLQSSVQLGNHKKYFDAHREGLTYS